MIQPHKRRLPWRKAWQPHRRRDLRALGGIEALAHHAPGGRDREPDNYRNDDVGFWPVLAGDYAQPLERTRLNELTHSSCSPCLFRVLSLSSLAKGCRKLVARQVEKGKPFAMGRRKIISRLNDDLNRRFSREHFDSDFGILEIHLMAASIGADDDGVRHVGPLLG